MIFLKLKFLKFHQLVAQQKNNFLIFMRKHAFDNFLITITGST